MSLGMIKTQLNQLASKAEEEEETTLGILTAIFRMTGRVLYPSIAPKSEVPDEGV